MAFIFWNAMPWMTAKNVRIATTTTTGAPDANRCTRSFDIGLSPDPLGRWADELAVAPHDNSSFSGPGFMQGIEHPVEQAQ